MTERIVVVAAVIEQDGRFLVARRLEGTHLAGYWEFPGGKVHDGRIAGSGARAGDPRRAELRHRSDARRIFHTAHTYPERTVELHFFRCELTGTPQPMLGQELRWIARARNSRSVEFPPADAELIAGLIHAGL